MTLLLLHSNYFILDHNFGTMPTMFLQMLLSSFLLVCTSAEQGCRGRGQGVYFDERHYDLEILKEGINNVDKLTVNQNDNTVYFIFDLLAGHSASAVGYIHLDTRVAGTVDGIKNPKALAVDQMYNIVYIGGADGIFRFNEKKVPVQLHKEGDNVISLFFKNNLYYTNARKEAYKYVSGYSTLLTELNGAVVDSLVIDRDSNIFFLQDHQLFRVKQGTRAINTHESYRVNCLATNQFGKVFACGHDGLYVYNKYKYDLEKISSLSDLKSLAFNRINEPVYGVVDKIVKLSLRNPPCDD